MTTKRRKDGAEVSDHADDTETVVLGEEYRAAATRYAHAAQRFQAAVRALRLDPKASVRRAMTFVAGLSYRELPKEAEPAFLDLQEQIRKLNAAEDENTSNELRVLCSQRLHSIARMLDGYAGT